MTEFYSQIVEDFPEFFIVYGDNRGRYPYSNSMMVQTSETSATLFDCGISHKSIRRLKKKFEINKVYLSHWHEDHSSGYASLKQSEFYCQELNLPPLQDFNTFLQYYGNDPEEDQPESWTIILKALKVQPIPGLRLINDNEILKISDYINVEVVHTPGHSAGHCCFYAPDCKIMFLADIDLSGLGPWYGCEECSVNDFEDSLKRLQNYDIKYAISGHIGLFTGRKEIKESLKTFLNVLYERDERVLNLLNEKEPKELMDLERKNVVYKSYDTEFGEYLVYAENVMIQHHLDRLIEKKMISKEKSGYILF
jgi:glyoxylase-like metal-dependent hydrolase (beta-lactamase superfamily II)